VQAFQAVGIVAEVALDRRPTFGGYWLTRRHPIDLARRDPEKSPETPVRNRNLAGPRSLLLLSVLFVSFFILLAAQQIELRYVEEEQA